MRIIRIMQYWRYFVIRWSNPTNSYDPIKNDEEVRAPQENLIMDLSTAGVTKMRYYTSKRDDKINSEGRREIGREKGREELKIRYYDKLLNGIVLRFF
jgi:hypothetical protein